MRYPHGRILIFAKAPVPGYAKTRLIPVLGAQGAADLQSDLIGRTVDLAVDSRLAPVELWICGDKGLEFFDAFRSILGGRIHTQTGPDLGTRMAHALGRSLERADFAVLIGTDCPVMDAAYVERACAALSTGMDAVLGPAEDGGYGLIGVRRSDAGLFRGIDWGSSHVLTQTRRCLEALNWRWQELSMVWDVDRPSDFARLAALDGSFPALLSTDDAEER